MSGRTDARRRAAIAAETPARARSHPALDVGSPARGAGCRCDVPGRPRHVSGWVLLVAWQIRRATVGPICDAQCVSHDAGNPAVTSFVLVGNPAKSPRVQSVPPGEYPFYRWLDCHRLLHGGGTIPYRRRNQGNRVSIDRMRSRERRPRHIPEVVCRSCERRRYWAYDVRALPQLVGRCRILA